LSDKIKFFSPSIQHSHHWYGFDLCVPPADVGISILVVPWQYSGFRMTDFVPDSPVFSILQFFQPLAYSAIINFCVFCAYVFRVSFCVFWCVAFCCPCVYTYDSKSIAGVPTGRKRFRATLLLYTTCMCSQRLWGGSGVYDSVAVLQTNKQTNKQTIGPLKATGKGHA